MRLSNDVSEIRAFFRFCPECGRRFHIKLVSKKLLDIERESVELKRTVPVGISPRTSYGTSMPILVQEGEQITIDVEEFQYTYLCKHCGHEWSEKHLEQHKES